MTTALAGISEVDLLVTPASDRAPVMMVQNEQIQLMQQQLTALARELASLRKRIGRNSRNSTKRPPVMARVYSRVSGANAVAASGVGSRGIPEQGWSYCRSNVLTTR
jgi:hypothetical protein